MFGTHQPSGASFADLLVLLATWLLLGCAAWVAAIAVAAVVEAASRGRVRATTWVGCPAAVRRLLLGGLGVALSVSPAPALATGSSPEPPDSASTLGLPVPARTVSQDPAQDPAQEPAQEPTRRIEVRAGDCLWDLARSRLPAGAPAGRVADLAHATYRRNRGVIGDDPDLIRAGQQLVLPRTAPSPRPEETP
jgi:nucleoid-associated protein YgaU